MMKKLKVGNSHLSVEVARKPEELERGLQARCSLPANRGMLFCYSEEKILKFWMKDTKIPLSIAFIDKGGKIFEIKDMQPMREKIIESSKPAKWALEVNQGWFEKKSVVVGDSVNCVGRGGVGIKIVKFPPETVALAKKIEDTLATMVAGAIKTRLGDDSGIENFHIDVESVDD